MSATDVKLSYLRLRNAELDRELQEHMKLGAPSPVEQEKVALKAQADRLEDQIASTESFLARRAKYDVENPSIRGAPERQIELPNADWSDDETALMAAVFSCGQWSKEEMTAFATEIAKLEHGIRVSALCSIIGVLVASPVKTRGNHETVLVEGMTGGVVLQGDLVTSEVLGNAMFKLLGLLARETVVPFMTASVLEIVRRVVALPVSARGEAAKRAIDALGRAVGQIQTAAFGKTKVVDPPADVDLGDEPPSNAPGATSSFDMEKDDTDHLEPKFGSFEPLGDPMLGDFAVDTTD